MVPVQPLVVALASMAFGAYYSRLWPFSPAGVDEAERFSCRPFLPKVFVETPPSAEHPAIKQAMGRLDAFLTNRFAQGDIDSLSVAVVTSAGPVFERNWGVTRGNESATSPPTTSHSSYRIASISKLFTVLEGLILEQRGVISWCAPYSSLTVASNPTPRDREDPVEKYLPEFAYRLDGFAPTSHAYARKDAPITLFQLATHMSGLGRDWPAGTVHNWPHDLQGGGPPPTNGLPFPAHAAVYAAAAAHHLTSPPYAYPAYSNTGTALLGIALVAANRAASARPAAEPASYAALLQRDVFAPLGMNGSHFLATQENKHAVVVPSLAPEVAVRVSPIACS